MQNVCAEILANGYQDCESGNSVQILKGCRKHLIKKKNACSPEVSSESCDLELCESTRAVRMDRSGLMLRTTDLQYQFDFGRPSPNGHFEFLKARTPVAQSRGRLFLPRFHFYGYRRYFTAGKCKKYGKKETELLAMLSAVRRIAFAYNLYKTSKGGVFAPYSVSVCWYSQQKPTDARTNAHHTIWYSEDRRGRTPRPPNSVTVFFLCECFVLYQTTVFSSPESTCVQ